MRSPRILIFTTVLLILSISLAACGISTGQPEPFSTPVANLQEITKTISETAAETPEITAPTPTGEPEKPTATRASAIVIDQPTMTSPTQSPSGSPQGKILPADIQIESPGDLSRISSPLQVSANVYPGDGGRVLVQLFGEDGRLMAEEQHTLEIPDSGWVQLYTSIPFEIHSAGERALLVISTRDGFGRRIAQSSVALVLLQVGASEIELPTFQKDPYVLSTPVYGSEIRNGIVHIEGFAHAYNGNPIVGELVTETGGIMKTIVVTLPDGSVGQEYVPFTMDIPFNVQQRKAVRLTLRQPDERLPNVDAALDSIVIYLLP